ncbi:hypothetical protein [Halorubrum vacuolatum]|uniref:Membrane associated serine protease, rhomboid family n=1 Tax=Halorubrum vacuolatum TaxID=63740 RepID=A0A238UVP2_HALVU|nr:hypothetical protein [Halorubrum vacuolatum]SNR25289.1 hypothetical protein SAMN06264855_101349 [Halorubrum vacuolatum]
MAGEGSGVDADDTPTVRGLARSAAAAIRSRPPLDLFLVAIPLPLLLVALSVLPGTETWRFSLAAEGVLESRTTLWTAFASSFVHTSGTHLIDNVVNYWLLVGVAYPLSVIAGWRRRLLYSMVIYLTVVPLASAWTTLAILGTVTNAPAAGFSDVNGALLGYLVVVWFVALSREGPSAGDAATPAAADVDARWSIVVALGALTVVFLAPGGVSYFPPLPSIAAAFAIATAVAAVGLLGTVGRPRIGGLDLPAARELLYVTAGSVAFAGILGSLVFVPFGSNVYAHLVGFVVGFIVPYVAFVVVGRSATPA